MPIYDPYAIDKFDAQCLGEIHRLVERLAIGSTLIEEAVEELEVITGGGKLIFA